MSKLKLTNHRVDISRTQRRYITQADVRIVHIPIHTAPIIAKSFQKCFNLSHFICNNYERFLQNK